MPAHHGHGSSAGRSSRPGGGSYRLPPREPETGRRPGMVQHARSKERACATPCGSRGDTPSHSVSYCVSLYHVHVLRAFALSQAVSQLRLREPSAVVTNQFSAGFASQQTDPAPSRIVSPPRMAGKESAALAAVPGTAARARKRPPDFSGGRDRRRKSCPRYRSSNC